MSYGVAYGHLSGRIHVGRLNKAGTTFLSKDDCTIPVALAVVEWVTEQHGGEVELTPKDGGIAYRITAKPVGGTATPADQPACEHFTGCICLADGRDPRGCRWRRPAPADQGEKP